ncbi:RNI-like protein [Exidia glandulosa HHB12029]|uniref:RNI-like protein n=1 Tax=Exidia glandulosa HHB12029 TaxID=1314781 RepID=A0A166AKI4_EXIGL|nr:RNI-like protein [Exidia glandulosa HHB12029]
MASFLARRSSDHLDLLDAGVSAQEIIAQLRARSTRVKVLTLGHNGLGDAGIMQLCEFLASKEGLVLGVESLSLNTNAIGDAGLGALGHLLSRRPGSMHTLFLQNNVFTDDEATLRHFAHCLNASRLVNIFLSSNALLDTGVSAFLSTLAAPRLRELHLSAVGLSSAGLPALLGYLASRRSASLRTLKLNGNKLGNEGVRALGVVIERCNWWLEELEVYANDDPDSDDNNVPPPIPAPVQIQPGAMILRPKENASAPFRAVLARNRLLRIETRRGALALLKVARIVLLHPRLATSNALVLRSAALVVVEPGTSPTLPEHSRTAPFAWLSLPYELRLHVLRFVVADTVLSAEQHARICAYAESPPLHNGLGGGADGGVEEWLDAVGCAWFDPGDGVEGVARG